MAAPGALEITVACSPEAGALQLHHLQLPEGSTLADALAASGVLQRHPALAGLPVGIWGRKQELGTLLRDKDRVEIYRPLVCDPKEARRLRYRQKALRDAERKQLKAAAASAAAAAVSGSPKP